MNMQLGQGNIRFTETGNKIRVQVGSGNGSIAGSDMDASGQEIQQLAKTLLGEDRLAALSKKHGNGDGLNTGAEWKAVFSDPTVDLNGNGQLDFSRMGTSEYLTNKAPDGKNQPFHFADDVNSQPLSEEEKAGLEGFLKEIRAAFGNDGATDPKGPKKGAPPLLMSERLPESTHPDKGGALMSERLSESTHPDKGGVLTSETLPESKSGMGGLGEPPQ